MHRSSLEGSPIEVAFTHNGDFAFLANFMSCIHFSVQGIPYIFIHGVCTVFVQKDLQHLSPLVMGLVKEHNLSRICLNVPSLLQTRDEKDVFRQIYDALRGTVAITFKTPYPMQFEPMKATMVTAPIVITFSPQRKQLVV